MSAKPDPLSDPKAEFNAIQSIHGSLQPLDELARIRVLTYILSLLEIDLKVSVGKNPIKGGAPGSAVNLKDDDSGDEPEEPAGGKGIPEFSSFAELHDAANPKTNADRALVAAYWFQVSLKQESFNAAEANKELTQLGHKIANITDAIDTCRKQKPALVLQLKKSGTSRQARKTYKISHAGIGSVEAMING